MEIYFATTNKGKFMSLHKDLQKHNINVIQVPMDLNEPRSHDIKEIAESKIKQAYSHIQKPTVVMDAGFYIDSLKGFPGTFVNFALETIGMRGILRLVEEQPRECEFRNCLAYMDETLKTPQFFFTQVNGTLTYKPRGEKRPLAWSDLWFIFIPDDCDKTLAEMSPQEYHRWRDNHLEQTSIGRQFYKWISTRIK